MLLKRVEIIKSPLKPGRVRLVGEVVYDNKAFPSELYWFDVPEEYRGSLSENGNMWLICLIPLAMTIGEPVRISLPVDRSLYRNIKQWQTIWKCWNPALSVVPIEADIVDMPRDPQALKRNAAFFSGGVDSFFTIFRHLSDETLEDRHAVDDLITVGGFDIPIDHQKEFDDMRAVLQSSAVKIGKNLIDVLTNIRTTAWGKANWGLVAHGCGLATIAHLMDKRFGHVLVGSTGGYVDMKPWGSHVLTDPLLTSSQLTIVHDGPEFHRLEKIKFITRFPVALESLHVCWKLASDKNCSNCKKCYRTMITLDMLKALDQSPVFDLSLYSVDKIRNIVLREKVDFLYMNDIRRFALQAGRLDVVKGVDQSIKRSKYVVPFLDIFPKFQNRRFLRRLGVFIDKKFIATLIQ